MTLVNGLIPWSLWTEEGELRILLQGLMHVSVPHFVANLRVMMTQRYRVMQGAHKNSLELSELGRRQSELYGMRKCHAIINTLPAQFERPMKTLIDIFKE